MAGRKSFEYRLHDADRHYLNAILHEGQLLQRVAIRARVLLALDRGERIGEIVRWLGVGRMTIWDLFQRYRGRGVAAIFDAERSGRPLVFSPAAESPDRAPRMHRAERL